MSEVEPHGPGHATSFTVTVLGCDGSYAGPGGACSGYLLRTETTTVWLDAGPGTLANLQRHVALGDLDAVVVSHEHPDHCLELPVLHNALKYLLHVSGLRVITTGGVRSIVDGINDGAEPTFCWEVATDGSGSRVGDLAFRFARSDHPVETFAVRVTGPGGSLVYSADTGNGFDPAALDVDGSGVDLALIEASLAPSREDTVQHLSGRQAGTMASALGARRLLLTHMSPGSDPAARCEEAASTFDGPIEVATMHHTYGIGH